MNKAKQARVRDELLQQLYTGVVHATLAAGTAGRRNDDAAVAAAVCANLHDEDVLLLPARAAGFRVLRGVPLRSAAAPALHEHSRHVYTLPVDTAQATALSLGAALGCAGRGHAVVCVVLPQMAGAGVARTAWAALARRCAELSLPVLFISFAGAPRSTPTGPHTPVPLYPAMPVDAGDALAAYRVAFESLSRARLKNGGPSWLEAVRLPGAPPALEKLEAALRRRGCFSKAWQRSVERRSIAALTRSV